MGRRGRRLVRNSGPLVRSPIPYAYQSDTPDGKTIYVAGLNTAPYRWEVTPIRTATNTALKPVLIPPRGGALLDGIGITPDGRTVYLLNEVFEPATFPGTVIPLQTATNTLGSPITIATAPSAIVFAR